MFSYGLKWSPNNQNTIVASYNPANPQEKVLVGIVSKPSKRLQLFAELKATPDNKTDFLAGYRANFSEGTVTGTFTSSLKAVTIYRRMMDMLQLTFTGGMDFSKPTSPASFGVAVSFGGM